MELYKYYSLDECVNKTDVLSYLRKLESDSKIEFEWIKDDDVIHIVSNWLNDMEEKELINFLNDNDIIDYPDYESYDDYDDDDYDDLSEF